MSWLPLVVTGIPSYTGPGDIISGATAWWGLRAYNSAAIGTKCVRIVRASDSTQQDFNTVSGGNVDVASITTFLTSTTGKVVTLYDQTGNANDVTQATSAAQPAFTLSGIGSKPCLTFSGAQGLSTAGNVSISQPFSASTLAERTTAASFASIVGDNGTSGFIGFNSSANTAAMYDTAAVVTGAATDNVKHSLSALFSGASSFLSVDGVAGGTSSPGTNAWAGSKTVGAATTVLGFPLTGLIGEVGLWASNISSSFITLYNNQNAWWV